MMSITRQEIEILLDTPNQRDFVVSAYADLRVQNGFDRYVDQHLRKDDVEFGNDILDNLHVVSRRVDQQGVSPFIGDDFVLADDLEFTHAARRPTQQVLDALGEAAASRGPGRRGRLSAEGSVHALLPAITPIPTHSAASI